MGFNGETSAALVFLILYTILFVLLLIGYIGRYLSWRSRYSVILFHVTIRLSSQATGLAFGIIGYQNVNLLVAYFILYALLFHHDSTSSYPLSKIAVQRVISHSCFAPTVSSSIGSAITLPARTAGSSAGILQGHLG